MVIRHYYLEGVSIAIWVFESDLLTERSSED